jgi:hypothetical protein
VGLGIGLLLVVVGLLAAIYAAYLHESGHHHDRHSVGSGLPPMSAAPTGVHVLEPATATATATASVDDTTEPLQPLSVADAGVAPTP